MPRIHGRQSAGTGAAQQSQQEGFGLIVSGMAERHDVRIELPSSALEKLVPRLPRGILNRPLLAARARPDILPVRSERQVERARHGG